ncbi:hypothetical protein [Rubritalea tangerina]|uniref:hypothetical protein n=1 Tax=Rubritalea tangerina TaxID=430798 RepID=UPI0036149B86
MRVGNGERSSTAVSGWVQRLVRQGLFWSATYVYDNDSFHWSVNPPCNDVTFELRNLIFTKCLWITNLEIPMQVECVLKVCTKLNDLISASTGLWDLG